MTMQLLLDLQGKMLMSTEPFQRVILGSLRVS
jgi:hypothetical protein